MKAAPKEPSDLSSLISAAQSEASRSEIQPLPETDKPASPARTLLMAGVAAAALGFAAMQLGPLLRPHTADQTARDLDAMVEQARDVVEATRTAQGRLPEALPNAALAALVDYAPLGNAYRLYAASGRVSVTLEPDGSKTVSAGAKP